MALMVPRGQTCGRCGGSGVALAPHSNDLGHDVAPSEPVGDDRVELNAGRRLQHLLDRQPDAAVLKERGGVLIGDVICLAAACPPCIEIHSHAGRVGDCNGPRGQTLLPRKPVGLRWVPDRHIRVVVTAGGCTTGR